jgi:hypothetical protein
MSRNALCDSIVSLAALPVISTLAKYQPSSLWAIMLHIYHIFFYPSLSDSNRTFNNPFNAEIPPSF